MAHLDGFLETLEESFVDALIAIDDTQRVVLFNPGAERLFGYTRNEIEGRELSILLPPRLRAGHADEVRRFAEGPNAAREVGERRQIIGRRKSGEEFFLEASIYRHGPPSALTMTALLRDAGSYERPSAAAMQQLAIIAEAGIGFFSHNHQTGSVFCSEALAKLLGLPEGLQQQAGLVDQLTAAESAWFLQAIQGVFDAAAERSREQEHSFSNASGRTAWVAVRSRTQFAESGGGIIRTRTVGVVRDVTQRRRREEQQRFLLALADVARRESSPEVVLKSACRMLCEHLEADRVIYTDIEGEDFFTRACYQLGEVTFPSQGKVADFGAAFLEPYLRGEVIAVSDSETDDRITEDERSGFRAAGIGAFAGLMLLRDGVCLGALGAHFHRSHTWAKDECDLLTEVVARVWSATQQLRAQRDLALSEARWRAAFEASSVGFCEADSVGGVILRANHAFTAMVGFNEAEVVGRPIADFLFPMDRQALLDRYSRLSCREICELRAETRFVRKGGAVFWGDVTANLSRAGEADPLFAVMMVLDVTETVRARQDLADANTVLEERVAQRTQELQAAMQRREEALAALAQAQRLEAIGRLTGGVVHDTNNMLTVISGNLEMIEDLALNEPGKTYLHEAQNAVERMKHLNRHLLTVARQRRLEPMVLDLNAQILSTTDMLRRVLGGGISLSTSLADQRCTILADALEVDNAILNLAINARDAMPGGGSLRISTRIIDVDAVAGTEVEALKPGRYCVVSISDTGQGIPADALPHVFEPFFTTKSVNQGTGLGLATVYGFMKQSGGHADITSEAGCGVTVSLYFPSVEAEPGDPDATQSWSIARGSGQLVLVVEDDAQVRRLTIERVRRLGYDTIEASDGHTALAKLEEAETIALVFSDVVMAGGMSGFELADLIEARWPGRRVLLTSGFDVAAERAASNGAKRRAILEKPYTQAELARAMRHALDS